MRPSAPSRAHERATNSSRSGGCAGCDAPARHLELSAACRTSRTVTELHRIEPFRARRRLLGIRARQAERFQARDLAHALRTHARIEHHDVAAHAVAHEIQRRTRREVVEQRVEIGEIVGEPIAVVRSLRAAEAAHVHRDQRARRREVIDDELPRLAGVAPSMHEHDGMRILARPSIELKLQAAQGEVSDRGALRAW